MRLHHVQVSCPPGGEDRARAFYAGVLGLSEVAKPPALAARGGAWFRSADGRVEVHVGVEADFAPARKAHPAFCVDGNDGIDAVAARAEAAGVPVDWDDLFPGYRRFHTADGNGNRVEILTPLR
ncbi:Catechol 2,3-dioxygenase [Actinopolymorpha cephalotaxi]|uniref:Catechol 2,3-dioxygenase n=1 Tax=Actinopolymorpha cephalotaxi TaxID=504797 RepID=A0A1I2LZ64_9ACTN|nr:VOC family protein [Actinopolymorpha cephalotaxi]NYH81512.1 catechol 2,3-dioxygenase-like lactoylglutathione lyase family enzyme [Actinopolymorpha cephalotaxi]SFF84523.1 Catechol 2,3-dioxygenase [Actinopolymorpha cephalotaxi]